MNIVKLDKDRELRFDYRALCALEEVCHVNVYEKNPFDNLSASRIRDLVWAAQLHTEKPLSREKVCEYLPLDVESLVEVGNVVAKALIDATKKKE